MKDIELEALLLAARALQRPRQSPITIQVMQTIARQATLAKQIVPPNTTRRKLLLRLRALHGAGLAVAVIIAITLLSGVAYASVRFVPDLLRLLDKKHNAIGRTEYSVPSFKKCYTHTDSAQEKFEVLPSAGLSDEDVIKTLQAKCELLGIDKFANDTWPTYGMHNPWHDGDTIFYARPDLMGTVKSTDARSITLREDSGRTKTYALTENSTPQAYSHGERIKGSSIRQGEYVFAIVQVSELYYKDPTLHAGNTQPSEHKLLALVKMSQPAKYYTTMQKHVTELEICQANPGERCSNAPKGLRIEIFPRLGEGGRQMNTFAKHDAIIRRIINGQLTAMSDDQLTITASSGARYTVGIGRHEIDAYNQNITSQYSSYVADLLALEIQLGSWLEVSYAQTGKENRQHITNENVINVTALTQVTLKDSKE